MEFYALPRNDQDIGATSGAGIPTIFIENASRDGVIDLFIADGRYNSSTRVAEGDTETEIATNVAAELSDVPGLPFDVVAAAGVVTLTAKNAGGVGNGMLPTR